jgi:hypothetical protein
MSFNESGAFTDEAGGAVGQFPIKRGDIVRRGKAFTLLFVERGGERSHFVDRY